MAAGCSSTPFGKSKNKHFLKNAPFCGAFFASKWFLLPCFFAILKKTAHKRGKKAVGMDSIIIGIAGGTGSGKTTLTRKLKERFGQDVSHQP